MTPAEEKVSLEEKINNSPLFGIDREAEPVIYDREKYKLLCLIGEYINKFYAKKYGDYGLEVTLSYGSCVKSYNLEKGPFLAYYMTSLANKCKTADAAENTNMADGGMHLSANQKRIIVAIRRLLEAKGIVDDEINDDVVSYVAKRLGLEYAAMKKAFKLYQSYRVVGVTTEVDGDEVSIADKYGETAKSAEELVVDMVNCYEIFDIIEDVYLNGIQVRQREVISPCLTALIAEAIFKSELNISSYQFIDKGIMRAYIKELKAPLRKDIAESLGKSEASVSRTMSNFLKDLLVRVKQKER